jgi:tetratricopeptide (TPR) repeat protein
MLSFLAIYWLICSGFFSYWYINNRTESFIWLIIVVSLPVLGFLYLILMNAVRNRISGQLHHLSLTHEEEENPFLKRTLYKKLDVSEEMNIVPMEEAILCNENAIKRKLLMNALKDNSIEYIGILEAAIQDEDSETSHYAAAAVLEMKRKLMTAIQILGEQYAREPNNPKVLLPYAEVLRKFLNSRFLDKRSIAAYRDVYSALLERLLDICPQEHKYFEEKINCSLDVGEYRLAEQYCDKFTRHHPDNEMSYILYLKLFYLTDDHARIQETLSRLKKARIKLSNQSMVIVRFWSDGVQQWN